MEAIAILVVIALLFALTRPEKKPDPPSAGDLLMKGIVATAKEVKNALNPTDKKPKEDTTSPWTFVIIAIVLGILATYLM